MKKFSYIFLTLLIFSLFLVGCTSTPTNTTDEIEETETETETLEPDDIADVTSPGGSVLVCYYSATGNTERVAEYIEETLGCSDFEIEPQVEYTSADLDYNNPDSRVSKEHDQSAQDRNVPLEENTPENWSNYTTVFIGYPIWFGQAAFPVDTFVKSNDFTNKTVIPFCTSGSSGIGDSATTLQSLTNTGTWEEGIRFPSNASQQDVVSWLASIGY